MTTFATPTLITKRSLAPLGIATAVVATVLTTLFAHGWSEVLTVVPIIVAAAALVFGLAVPRALRKDDCGGTALALAVPAALLAAPAFWSGLPLVLGVAAMVVGNAGRDRRAGSGKSITALVLATLAVLFYLSVYVMEGLAGKTGFLLD